MAAPLGRGGAGGLPPRPGASSAASASAAAASAKSTSYELVRMAPGGENALLHHLVRFDDGEDPFGKGQPPFFCYQEKEEIAPDEDEPEADGGKGGAGGQKQRPPRASVRWTLEDASSVRSGSKGGANNGLLYHGKPLATAPGLAYVLMVPNRAAGGGGGGAGGGGKKQIFVVPVGPWIGYQRVADAVEVPTSVKEAEALMKGAGPGGNGGKRGGRPRKEDAEPEEKEEKLTRRQLLERFLTKSRAALEKEEKGGGGGGKGKAKGGGGKRKGGGGGGAKGLGLDGDDDDDNEGPGGRGKLGLGGGEDEFGGDDLAQNADTRELIGLGSDNEDEYEFQDDEEDIHIDVNNVRVGEEEELTEEEEDEEEEEEEEDDEAAAALRRLEEAGLGDGEEDSIGGEGGGGGGDEPSAKRGKLSIKDLEKRFERPAAASAASAPAPAPAPAAPPGAGAKRPAEGEAAGGEGGAAGGGGGAASKKARLTFEAGSLEASVRERLIGLGGRVKGKDLSREVKDLLKSKSDVERVKFILGQIAATETDPVDGGKVYLIKPEYARR